MERIILNLNILNRIIKKENFHEEDDGRIVWDVGAGPSTCG